VKAANTRCDKVNDDDRKIMGDLEGFIALKIWANVFVGATHVIDFEWMSKFDVKPDYHRCGGRVRYCA